MSKCLVTGGAGFIGSHLVDKLIELGHDVIVIDNLMLGKKEFINKQSKFYKADIRNLEKIKKLFKDVEVVFHLAADPRLQTSIEDPISTHEINVTGTLNILLAAKESNVKKVIFSSSCAIYGDQEKLPITEKHSTDPMNPYALHKLMGENYCRLFHQLFDLDAVCLRYFNVFGPRKLDTGSYPMVVPIFLGQKKRGEKLTIVGDGKQTRDYVYVSDVVEANIKAWQSDISDGRGVNIGSGVQTSVNEIAELIGGESVNVDERPGEMKFIEADNTKAKKLLDWGPTIGLEEGIKNLKEEWNIT
ncbi:MAG: NAD-dependent epimerase/dehydratase family protein [Candidatus Magasanikbacteria bacterium]|jgi:UDP-glucose 4-epimerase|nr:NAD-dependent epimerase/dehydratase family protein [Candidatus Magasanikbacteria bacterium]MBT4314799.1 NAD-dependent epimerase/dehydratase family protein [Candidatus Magasanikbacteria bacterium]MBT4547576.1 NAD-dependent epimerase/dehydratase family protein [Candidatus Magasanikbacteria bacterium]MBT6818825.1 NAD-dependent epimerase/dehydratase family protein [Candidatus Magasanikbacteria bacterium]